MKKLALLALLLVGCTNVYSTSTQVATQTQTVNPAGPDDVECKPTASVLLAVAAGTTDATISVGSQVSLRVTASDASGVALAGDCLKQPTTFVSGPCNVSGANTFGPVVEGRQAGTCRLTSIHENIASAELVLEVQ